MFWCYDLCDDTFCFQVLRAHEKLHQMNNGCGPSIPYCAFNGGSDAWVDVGNKRVGVQVLQAYLGIEPAETVRKC